MRPIPQPPPPDVLPPDYDLILKARREELENLVRRKRVLERKEGFRTQKEEEELFHVRWNVAGIRAHIACMIRIDQEKGWGRTEW